MRFEVPPSHPAFEGHFPGHPVLPAVAVLAMILEAVRAERGPQAWISSIPSARWRRPIRPGDVVEVGLAATPQGQLRFEVRCGAELIGNGTAVAS
jgi:3-hydroxyacyl-[acyl-carrier-protein] dehydratase